MGNSTNIWNGKALDIFADAINISDASLRNQFVETTCDTNELVQDVESLLRDHDQSAGFLDTPAINALLPPDSELKDEAGSIVGVYKLLEVIGEGGFGTVYMAEQEVPIRRRVALKVIKPGMDSREVIARFEAERQALAMMDHPNIAKVIDAGTTDLERPYFVMELVKGVPITQFCDDNRLPIHKRLELFIDVCMAVQHAHQKSVIHRDLHPSNVMVTLRNGKPFVKVIDFGIAKALHRSLTDKTLFTSFGQLIGTPQYMSPEQALNSSNDVDTRSDIFSLGVLLFELLTGSTPLCPTRLSESGYDELRRIIIDEDLPKPSDCLRSTAIDLPAVAEHRSSEPSKLPSILLGDVDLIVMQSLDKDRDRRYSTAERFANDIQRFLDGKPIEARPPSSMYRLRKFIKRNRATVIVICALATALLVGIIATSWALVRVQNEMGVTRNAMSQLETANANLEVTNKHLRDKFLHEAIASAMSPNRERTMRSLSIAKEAGASESRYEMVRGILARSEGRTDSALAPLTRAVELDPTNLAAKCELLGVSFDQGELKEFYRLKKEIDAMEPSSAEDYIFKGKAWKLTLRYAEALELIEQGQTMHANPIFQVFHADVLGDIGFHSQDLHAINAAFKELVDAQTLLGTDHDGIRTALIDVIRKFVSVARLKNEQYDHLLTLGDRCASSLSHSTVPTRHLARALYYYEVKNSTTEAKEAWLAIVNNSSGDLWRTVFAAFLLKTEGIEEAFAQFQQLQDERSHLSLAWESLLLALDNDERRAKAAELWERVGNEQPDDRHIAINTGVLLGDKNGLRRVTQNWTEPTWLRDRIYFINGKLSESEFLQRDSDGGNYLIAMKSLNQGDREKAMRSLEVLADKGPFLKPDYIWAGGILAEMRRRPDWPAPFDSK